MASKDLDAVFSYAQSQNISIDKQEFTFQVETHPDYPSLLAYSDALNFFNIENVVFKTEIEKLDILPEKFLSLMYKPTDINGASLEPIFTMVEMKNGKFYVDELFTQKEQFLKSWSSIVLLIEKPSISLENNKSKNSTTLVFVVLAMLVLGVVYFFSNSLLHLFFGVISVVGIFLSIEAQKTELGLESKVSQAFCNVVSNADCGQVINSDKRKWMQKIKISDISLWFFTSQLLALFIFSVAELSKQFLTYTLISLVLSVPMTFYSVYFQYKIEKKWCPICLSIIGIVYTELCFMFFTKLEFSFEFKTLLPYIVIFFIIFGLVAFLKPVFLERKEVSEKYIKYLRFARNFEVFKNTLQKSETKDFNKEYIVLGNRESKHKISIITNPFCGHCKDAHYILDKILARYTNKIAVSIRFNFDDSIVEKPRNLFLRLGEIYEQEGDNDFMEALKNWFENRNLENWLLKFGIPKSGESIDRKLQEVAQENTELELNFTPVIFLNQYNYPKQYDRESLMYFIADWLEDDDL